MISEIKYRIRFARYDLAQVPERAWRWIAWRLPKELVKWAAIRLGCHATQGEYSNQDVPSLYFMDALKRWDDKP